MPRLSARLAAAGGLDDRFGSRRWIGRRGRGGVGGVAVELAAEFVEFGLQLGDLLLGLLQSNAELAALRTGELRGRRHLAHSSDNDPEAEKDRTEFGDYPAALA